MKNKVIKPDEQLVRDITRILDEYYKKALSDSIKRGLLARKRLSTPDSLPCKAL